MQQPLLSRQLAAAKQLQTALSFQRLQGRALQPLLQRLPILISAGLTVIAIFQNKIPAGGSRVIQACAELPGALLLRRIGERAIYGNSGR